MIQVSNLSHRFGERAALNEVSFEVAGGTICGLLGPNGSGKTTLFRILATILAPTSGTGHIAGFDVRVRRAEVRSRIGVVFQNPSLDGKLTVTENLLHHGHLYGLRGGILATRMDEALVRFGLIDRKRDRAEHLSGGLKRRVEIAKATLHRPSVLLLDEPSTGLDPGMRRTVFDHLRELRQRDGVTTLLTTHLMEEADGCDQVAVMDGGKLVAIDTPSNLKHRVGGDVVVIHATNIESLGPRMEKQWGVQVRQVDGSLQIERERGHEFVPQLIETFPGEIESVTVGKPTLEDVFLRLTGHRLRSDAESAIMETVTR